MTKAMRRLLGLLPVILAVTAQAAFAKHNPGEVLVVYNANSPVSAAIAKDYAQKRHVKNMLAVKCTDSALNTASETIALADYTAEIANPVSKYLFTHDKIDFIVLTKGVPLRIRGGLTGEAEQGVALPSLDSYLSAIDYPTIPGAVKARLAGSGTTGSAWINRYYNATGPFSHAKYGGYLVTRLDGYTQADAMGLVTQALTAEATHPAGNILFDIQPDFGLGDKTTQPTATASTTVTEEEAWSKWHADMLRAADILEASGVPHILDLSPTFVGDQNNLLGYFSYGSNDSHFDPNAYKSLRFAPGSISDTAVSTSGRTFLPTKGGQSLMADLIAHGLTCCQGYVGEPILDAISSPTIDLSRYLTGSTMAESFYAASKYVGWETVCIGDPLCCPYAGRSLVTPVQASAFSHASPGIKTEPCAESGLDVGSISTGDFTSYEKVNLNSATSFVARVASGGDGGNIELRIDRPTGKLIGTCAVPATDGWQSWTTRTCALFGPVKGKHRLYLVYTGGGGNLFNVEWFAFRGAQHRHGRRLKL